MDMTYNVNTVNSTITGAEIDDTTPALNKVYSSQKVSTTYQPIATAYNTSNIVYSSSEPASPVAGMIWLKPVS